MGDIVVFDLDEMSIKSDSASQYRKIFEYHGKKYFYKHLSERPVYYELIAHKIAERLGIPSAPCYFTKYNHAIGISSEMFDTKNYVPISDILYETYGNDECIFNNLEDIWYALEKKFDEKTTARLMDELTNIFLFDILIGNGDRHSENLGLIIDGNSVKFAPLFDHEYSLFVNSINKGIYHMSVSKNDQENSVVKFLKDSDSLYTERLQAMLPVISTESLEEIFLELESEGVTIPLDIKMSIFDRFATNREMINNAISKNIVSNSK